MSTKCRFCLSAFVAALCLLLTVQSSAQTFNILHNFDPVQEGGQPLAGVLLSNTNIYGTTSVGGTWGDGTVFKLNTNGTSFAKLYEFTGASDGALPSAELLSLGDALYGTTASGGGSGGYGNIFALGTIETTVVPLYVFSALIPYANSRGELVYTNRDGAAPVGPLVLAQNTLYGTASGGGDSGNGTVFKINIDGTDFMIVHGFSISSNPPEVGPNNNNTNTDGINPSGALALVADTLYGAARYGGASGYGTVFSVSTNGTHFNTLHSFSIINGDGGTPVGGVIVSSNVLYGTASEGESSGRGTVFKVDATGSNFMILHKFTSLPSSGPFTNSDGAFPYGALALSGTTLYGSAWGGGNLGQGLVFKLNTDGMGFRVLHTFTGGIDGGGPLGGLMLSGNTLYGTTRSGGSSGNGVVFSISLGAANPPQLAIVSDGTNVILTWPSDTSGFVLESAANLDAPVWTASPLPAVVINGQNTVTNPISGTLQFYRLSQ